MARFRVRRAQYRRRMNGGQHAGREIRWNRTPSVLRHPELPSEQRLRSRCPKTHQDPGLHEFNFGLKPWQTSLDLHGIRLRVDAPFSARFPLEVLDDIRHVSVGPCNTGFDQCLVKQLARWSDEWLPCEVFFIARLLTHKHQARVRTAFAEHRLSAPLPQRACLAARRLLAHLLE